jgi:peroxiredoxin
MDLEINRIAPDFGLPDLNKRIQRLRYFRGKIVIVNFWSAECPHSERTDRSTMSCLVQWGPDVVYLPIASNRSESAQMVMDAANERHLPTVLIDADQRVADLYEAQTTPHVFVIDREGVLRYRGAVDNVTFRQRKPTRFYLEEAIEAMLENKPLPATDTPAYGCTIIREV